MKTTRHKTHAPRHTRRAHRTSGGSLTAAVLLAASVGTPAFALEIETGNPDLKVNWDTNLKYSNMWRVKSPMASLVSEFNQDDGNRNFKRGIVSNRVDLLTELDVGYKDVGFRVSGAAWYDDVYNGSTDNNSPLTNNSLSVGHRDFTDATKRLHGRKAEFLDAFVYGRFDAAGMPLTVRLGKHTMVYGETLFFGSNGIAAAQGPVDVVKALSVPNTQFKELLMPVAQMSGQLQINSEFSLGAYYQFDWKSTRLPGAGSFFSSVDGVGTGAESLLPGLVRGRDMAASDNGQGGAQLRWRPTNSDAEYGFYAVRYHDKTPQVYVLPGTGNYRLVYPEGIKAYGASVSTVLGDANVAGELSFRDNMPLVSPAQVDLAGTANNSGHPLYAVGRTMHLNVSAIQAFSGTSFFDSATVTAEAGWNRLLSVTKNRAALDPVADRDAVGFRLIFEPNYYQVASGLDLSVPIGFGYNIKGRSAIVGGFNGGVHRGGDFSIGLKGEYLKKLRLSLNYTHYFGGAKTTLEPHPALGYVQNYGQAMKDRNNIAFSAQYSF